MNATGQSSPKMKSPLTWIVLLFIIGFSLYAQLNQQEDQTAPSQERSTEVSRQPNHTSATSNTTYSQPGIPGKVWTVLRIIQENDGDPPAGYVGGRTFQNRERRLPQGRYREYDVNPKIRGRNRGAERLVIEQQTGKAYYTDDHYKTFTLIERTSP